jgi:hypothetical protein
VAAFGVILVCIVFGTQEYLKSGASSVKTLMAGPERCHYILIRDILMSLFHDECG